MTLRFLLLSVCVSSVKCPPEATKTHSYCSDINIPLDLGCDNSFLIKDMALARVFGDHAVVLRPFYYNRDRGTMQILEARNFTHRSLCELQNNVEKEEMTDYQHSPCAKHNAASAFQGAVLSVVLTGALVGVMFH